MRNDLGSGRRGGRLVLAVLGTMMLLLGLQLPVLAGRSGAAAPGDTARLNLTSVSPNVATPGQPLVVMGTVTNTGDEPIAEPVVRLGLAGDRLTTRGQVSDWVDGDSGRASTELGRTTLQGPMAPDSSRAFQLLVPAGRMPTDATRTNLAAVLSLTDGGAAGATDQARLQTVIPWSGTDDPVADPIEVSWVVPLTLPADPALFSAEGEKRLAAWRRAIGPNSHVDQLLRQLRGLPVTWLVDPTMLEPPISPTNKLPSQESTPEGSPDEVPTPTPEPSPTPNESPSESPSETSPEPSGSGTAGATPSPSGTGGAPSSSTSTESPTSSASPTATEPPPDDSSVSSLVGDLRQRLVNRGDTQPVWWLPYGDPDLVALDQAGGEKAVREHLDRAPSTANEAMSDVVLHWPAADPTSKRLSSISKVWSDTRPDTTPPTLLSTAQVSGVQGVAGRLKDGTPVLRYDERLSTFTGEAGELSSAQRVQAFLADSLSTYLRNPDSRDLLVLAPRHGEADPDALGDIMSAVGQAPWLQGASSTEPLVASGSAPRTAQVTAPASDPSPDLPQSPITRATLDHAATDRRLLREIGSILVDSDDVVSGWNAAYDELGSVRWRGKGTEHGRTLDELGKTLEEIPEQVAVRPGSINFFTDEGEVGVTVVNELNRPVHRVRLELEPRLAILVVDEQPEPLTIRADSRATVRVPLKALSSGQVDVDTRLTTPTGLALGGSDDAPTQLEFTVRPTGSWLYWVLGAVAGPILVIGIYRSLRKPRRDPEPGLITPDPQHEGDDD